MFIEALYSRIDDYNKIKRLFQERDESMCQEELNTAVNSVIVSITILVLVYMCLFIMAMYFAFRCTIRRGYPITYAIALILLTLIPKYGGIFMLGIVSYGLFACR